MRQAARATALLLLALACSGGPGTPEARVRARLAKAEAAAEARDAGALRELISEGYADAHGQDRDAVRGIIAFHLLRNRSVHLLTSTRNVRVGDAGTAEVEVYAAMAGTPITGPEALAGLRADLYRFDLRLEEETDGEWRVVSAVWERAMPADFLPR